jgi:hypothetical protein
MTEGFCERANLISNMIPIQMDGNVGKVLWRGTFNILKEDMEGFR